MSNSKFENPKISVIIPTYKRPEILMQGLESLQNQTCNLFEIVVVDNATNKSLRNIIEKFNKSVKLKVVYSPEPNLGLHNARHNGTLAAKAEILVFTDDDATFDENWLNSYIDAFESHPEMVASGGPVRPIWNSTPPKWLLEYMGNYKKFGMLSLMEPYKEFKLGNDCYFFGVNMAIRRDTLFQLGGFNPELIGAFTIGDGESGLLKKIQNSGLKIGYVPDAIVYHHIPKSRMTIDYFCRWQAHLAGAQLYAKYNKRMPGKLRLITDWLYMFRYFVIAKAKVLMIRSKKDRFSINLQLKEALWRAKLNYVRCLITDKNMRKMVTQTDWLDRNFKI